MANPDRLTALDSTFLHLEDHSTAHMHVASVMVFQGSAPSHQELIDHVMARLHLVPRYRQRLAHVPLGQGRPVWTDDPHFNPSYHIRHTALPKPADDAALKRLAGRLFSQRLDRSKPLWEIWLVQSMSGGRFALVAKTHHALVDGISGVDITTVLFDTARQPAVPPAPPTAWSAKPLPGPAKLLGEALLERSTVPNEMLRGARALMRAPRRAVSQVRDGLANVGATTLAGINDPAPPTRSTSTSARTGATRSWTPTWPASRRSRTRLAARSTTWCSPRSASRWGATCGAKGSTPRAWC